ncbi:MAG: pilin [Patescibacteria group bacterium]
MKKVLCFIILLIISLLFVHQTVTAQMLTNTDKPGGLSDLTNAVATEARFGKVEVGFLVARIIQVALGLLAVIFLILMIIAGFRWMTAGGNDEQVKKATSTIKTSIIGLVIVLAAYAITYFVFRYLPFSGGGGGMPNPV